MRSYAGSSVSNFISCIFLLTKIAKIVLFTASVCCSADQCSTGHGQRTTALHLAIRSANSPPKRAPQAAEASTLWHLNGYPCLSMAAHDLPQPLGNRWGNRFGNDTRLSQSSEPILMLCYSHWIEDQDVVAHDSPSCTFETSNALKEQWKSNEKPRKKCTHLSWHLITASNCFERCWDASSLPKSSIGMKESDLRSLGCRALVNDVQTWNSLPTCKFLEFKNAYYYALHIYLYKYIKIQMYKSHRHAHNYINWFAKQNFLLLFWKIWDRDNNLPTATALHGHLSGAQKSIWTFNSFKMRRKQYVLNTNVFRCFWEL